jgi:deazaflavin-dependent oxidoreductase (nitroreductase family)
MFVSISGQESRSPGGRAALTVTSMTANPQTDGRTARTRRKPGTPGAFSRWMQHRMNARMNRKVRRGRGTFMGMDVLILHTEGRHSGESRETPVAWFTEADGDDADGARLIVASGGGSQNPDWYANLTAHADRASIELPGDDPVPVIPQPLDGADREQAWQRIAAAQPRIAKYQSKADRQYPVVRLAPR